MISRFFEATKAGFPNLVAAARSHGGHSTVKSGRHLVCQVTCQVMVNL